MPNYFKELNDYLSYDPVSGEISWIKPPRMGVSIGEAGGKDKDGYLIIGFSGQCYKAHRLAYYLKEGYTPENDIDHINGIKDDNRWCNLREVNRSCNNINSVTRKDNKKGLKGVCWLPSKNTWKASLKYNGVNKIATRKVFNEAVKLRYEWETTYCTNVCKEKSPAFLYLKKEGLI